MVLDRSRLSEPAVKAAKGIRELYRHQHKAYRESSEMRPSLHVEPAHANEEQIGNEEVRESPAGIHARRGQPFAWWVRKRALERVARDSVDEVRNESCGSAT